MNATLVVAVLGVVLSTASLAWQFADYLLSGPRILVHLLHGVADDQLSSVRSWSLDSVPDRDVMDARLADPTRELAVVVVRNIGRSSVYLVSVGLAAGRTGRLRYDTTTAGFDTDRVRLEPGDRYISQADLWPLIDELRSTRPEPTLAVTAVVELGNGRGDIPTAARRGRCRRTYDPSGPARHRATSRPTGRAPADSRDSPLPSEAAAAAETRSVRHGTAAAHPQRRTAV
jgi:hypothetical protein